MSIRICFEPHTEMEINDAGVFRYYAENYLSDFDVVFGGCYSMDAGKKKLQRLEPVWQFLTTWQIYSETDVAMLLHYFDDNPLNGYYIHVFEDACNENQQKIY